MISKRGKSSAMSAATAIADHLRDWTFGTNPGEWVSMGVVSDGAYGIERGLIYSFPVVIRDGEYHIVRGLEINQESNLLMNRTMEELLEERDIALKLTQ